MSEKAKQHTNEDDKQVHLWEISALVLLYVIFAKIGQMVAIPPGNVTPFWPAAGIILTAVILKGYRIWPGIWLGAVLGNGWAYADFSTIQTTANFLLASNLNGAGDTLCAFFGYYMLRRTGDAKKFIYNSRAVLNFIAFAAIIASTISATFGVGGLCLSGILPWDAYVYTWITWSVGDGVGILVVVPLLTALNLDYLKKTIHAPFFPELVVFIILISAYAYFSLGYDTKSITPNYLATYIVFPILVWASYRYGGRAAYLIVAIFSGIAIYQTSIGQGVFFSESINISLIQLQMFIACATITTLFLNAVIFERSHITGLLEKANNDLEISNKEMAAFSYSISHDIKTPVRAVISFGQLLKEECADILSQEQKNHLNRIIRAGKRMAELIDDIITLSLLSNKTLAMVEINVSKMAQDIATSLKNDNPDRNIDIKIEDNMRSFGDEKLIYIALANLISNAWKYTIKQPTPVIEIKSETISNSKVFTVADNGIGFNNKYKDKLFDIFQRLHADHEFPGTGIGLATVKRIIDRHNGKVWAEGKTDEGAKFHITLNSTISE